MKAIFWNIRGMGKKSRVGILKDFILREGVDIVGVQETIKQFFSTRQIHDIAPSTAFQWNWLPATGHSGGFC